MYEMDASSALPSQVINDLWEKTGIGRMTEVSLNEVNEDLFADLQNINLNNNEIRSIKDELRNIKGEILDDMKQMNAYVMASAAFKLPEGQELMEQHPEAADQTPDKTDWLRTERIDEDEWRRKLQDEYKSNDKRPSKLEWYDLLQKDATLTTSRGYAPAMHHVTYGKKKCKTCEDLEKHCGCGK